MKKKFLLNFALVVGLGITGFATAAEAANIGDTSYTFYISSKGSISHTEIRPKYDATSAYMKFNWMEEYSSGAYQVKVVDANGNDFSKSWWSPYFSASTKPGTQTWIPNQAYEDRGYGVQVRLKAEGAGGFGIWSSGGAWSPDSVR